MQSKYQAAACSLARLGRLLADEWRRGRKAIRALRDEYAANDEFALWAASWAAGLLVCCALTLWFSLKQWADEPNGELRDDDEPAAGGTRL